LNKKIQPLSSFSKKPSIEKSPNKITNFKDPQEELKKFGTCQNFDRLNYLPSDENLNEEPIYFLRNTSLNPNKLGLKSKRTSSPGKLAKSFNEISNIKIKKANKYIENYQKNNQVNSNLAGATKTNFFSCLETATTNECAIKTMNNKSNNFFTTQTDNQSQIEGQDKHISSIEEMNLNTSTNIIIQSVKDFTKVPKIKISNDSFEINGKTSRSLQSSKKIKKLNNQEILDDLKQEINKISVTDKEKIRSLLKNRTNFVRTCYMNKKSKNQLTTFSLKKAKEKYKNVNSKVMSSTQSYFERSFKNNLLKSNFQKANYLKFVKSKNKKFEKSTAKPYAELSSKIFEISEKNLKRSKTSYKKNLEMKSKIDIALKQKYQSEVNDLNRKIDDRLKNDAKNIHISQGAFIYGTHGGCFMKNRQAIHGMHSINYMIK
jgi:hypothetical protein